MQSANCKRGALLAEEVGFLIKVRGEVVGF